MMGSCWSSQREVEDEPVIVVAQRHSDCFIFDRLKLGVTEPLKGKMGSIEEHHRGDFNEVSGFVHFLPSSSRETIKILKEKHDQVAKMELEASLPRRSSVSSKKNWPKRKDLIEAKAKFTRFSSELDHARGGRAGSG
ncbi:hypothetical protein Pyn_07849 [Prunus yedoensis var. nudiflora]|uniref:Uncharacterized protein n=1 Tax=Prunus yedoensis var. nudiflora TaxID=2094558 RepID=A0A314ZPW1_PRUYE|nr:hypothetical protein Pyn_07849 [Prunus yedoensis var. nudiflora]